mmetsp:Transcript_4281/g.9620  ORF Transcript_4281/g.9620 Transcript_4281/m.9620 type:complete len:249 (+) Transcript_4281:497-1243(+)
MEEAIPMTMTIMMSLPNRCKDSGTMVPQMTKMIYKKPRNQSMMNLLNRVHSHSKAFGMEEEEEEKEEVRMTTIGQILRTTATTTTTMSPPGHSRSRGCGTTDFRVAKKGAHEPRTSQIQTMTSPAAHARSLDTGTIDFPIAKKEVRETTTTGSPTHHEGTHCLVFRLVIHHCFSESQAPVNLGEKKTLVRKDILSPSVQRHVQNGDGPTRASALCMIQFSCSGRTRCEALSTYAYFWAAITWCRNLLK